MNHTQGMSSGAIRLPIVCSRIKALLTRLLTDVFIKRGSRRRRLDKHKQARDFLPENAECGTHSEVPLVYVPSRR